MTTRQFNKKHPVGTKVLVHNGRTGNAWHTAAKASRRLVYIEQARDEFPPMYVDIDDLEVISAFRRAP